MTAMKRSGRVLLLAAALAATPAPSQGPRAAQARPAGEHDCSLEPHQIVNVGSPVNGVLAEVSVDRGASVAKGQVVARLLSDVEAATVELRRARREFGARKAERNEELFRKQLISIHEKDELETNNRLAEMELLEAIENLNLRIIRSPFNGVVMERFLAPGDLVRQEKILRLAQVNPLNVEVVLPAELYGAVRVGAGGEVQVDAPVKLRARARIVAVDRVIDAASGTFRVRLELSNPDHRIPAGLKCRVKFG